MDDGDRTCAKRLGLQMRLDKEKLDVFIRTAEILDTKERLLAEIVVWLKTKNLWEECKKSLSIKLES